MIQNIPVPYFPLTLIVCTAAFNLLSETYLTHNARSSMVHASKLMVVNLAVEIPVMLIACLLAVKFLDAAFGPLWPAMMKLSAIALAPDAVSDMIVLVAFLIGRASGNPHDLPADLLIGKIVGWALSLLLYFWLFMYFFELEFGEVYRLVIFVWLVRLFFTWLVMAAVFSYYMR
jgi:hypothetical protein